MPIGSDEGPYLIAALLCEKTLQEKDGVISLIRAVDKITNSPAESDPPEQMPPFLVNLSLVIVLKAGASRGRFMIKVRPTGPDGGILGETEIPSAFGEADDAGVNLVVNFALIANHQGLYWVDILLNDQLATRTPLRIEYLPMRTGAQGPPFESRQ